MTVLAGACAVIAAGLLAQSGPVGNTVLHEVPLEAPAGLALKDATIVLQLAPESVDRENLLLGRGAVKGEGATVTIRPGGQAVDRAEPTDAHRASTFLVDHADPAVATLKQASKPSLEALRAFVHAHIQKKGMARGYDAASVTARRREGDCTEHAVLLAALARAHGLPSRVIHGIVIASSKGHVGAYGHAWTEVFADGRWQLLDATLAGESVELVYLPMNILKDEGPAYVMGLLTQAGPNDVLRVSLRPAPKR